MHLETRSTPYVTTVVLVGYRTVLVDFRITSIEVLKQRLRATITTRCGRVSATGSQGYRYISDDKPLSVRLVQTF